MSALGEGSVVRGENSAHRAKVSLCAEKTARTGRRLRCARIKLAIENESIVKTAVILPAAGFGTRMQRGVPPVPAETTGTSRKQFMLLEGAPILVHTVRKFVASPLMTDIVGRRGAKRRTDWVEDMLRKEGR